MNDFSFKLLPLNQYDLELDKQGDKFPAKSDEVDTQEELQFYIYPFAKMEEFFESNPYVCLS